MNSDYLVIFVTCPDIDNALKIKDILLKEKLAACVNLIKDVHSFFIWSGKIDSSNEVLLIIKSKKVLFERIMDRVKINHSYDIPEIIALPIVEGNREYLDWIENSVN